MSSFISDLETTLRRYRVFALLSFFIFAALVIRDMLEPSSAPIVQLTRIGVGLFLLLVAIITRPKPFILRHISLLIYIVFLAILMHLINVTWHRNLAIDVVILDLIVMALSAGVVHNRNLCLAILVSWAIAFTSMCFFIPDPIFTPIYFITLLVFVSLVSYSLLSVFVTAQERLDAKEKMLIQTQTVARMAGWEFNAENDKMIWSKSTYSLLGITNDGETLNVSRFFKDTDDFSAFKKLLRKCIRDKEELNTTIEIQKDNGQCMWIQCRGDVILKNEKPVGMVGVILDVTESVTREQELVKAKELAETAAEARTRFLANMSHEIRTPMNGVIGMTSILLNGNLPDKERAHVDIIRRSGEALLVIINEILDFSKYESGSVELSEGKFSLNELVSDALDAVTTQAENKGLSLYLDMPLLPHLDYIGDSSRLRQVLVNLLGNAVKFTEQGHITLTIQIRDGGNSTTYFEFSVADTGIGIAAHNIAHLFDPFTQEDASTTRRFGGTGLGLAISNEIVRAMDGGIKVSSTLRKGSTFSFSIGLKSGQKIGASTGESTDKTTDHLGPIALLSNDEKLTNILSNCIESLNGTTTIVQSPDFLIEGEMNTKQFSSILIDTDMDNEENVKSFIRKLEVHYRSQLILIGSVAVKFQDQKHPWLRKPVRLQELLKTLQRSDDPIDNVLPTQALSSKHAKLKVLLAEDNIVNQKVAQHILEKLGCSADLAINGKEAVHLLSEKDYDIILMDIQMPEIDGLEATQLIRSDPEMQQPYIIAMTANVMEDDRQQCMAAGMDDFIPKPVRIDDVSRAMERAHLQISQKH